MSANFPARSTCRSYGPGHAVHWIQARKSLEPGQERFSVSVVVHPDGLVDLRAPDLEVTMWTHEPERLASHFAPHLSSRIPLAEWRPRFHVLKTGHGAFNLATPEERTPCIVDDDDLPIHANETPSERLVPASIP